MKNENLYQYKDEDGSYSVRFGDRTIEVKFVGFLNLELITKFCADLEMMLRVIEWQYWGYYGDLSECDDQSSESSPVLIELHKRFLEQGCVVDAYTINSDTAAKHVSESRKASGVKQALDTNVFPTSDQAIQYIHKILDKINKK